MASSSPLDQLYGSTQNYTNPSWMSTGQGYAQSTGGITDVYMGTPMSAQPGIDPNMIWNSNSSLANWNSSQAPIFRASDVNFSGSTPGFQNEAGNTIGGTNAGINIAGDFGNNGQSVFTPIGGNQFSDNWDPNQGFTFGIRNAKDSGTGWDYKLDPTGQYFMPSNQRGIAMPHGQAFGPDFWMPLAFMAAGAGGIAGAGGDAAALGTGGAQSGGSMAGWGTEAGMNGAYAGGGAFDAAAGAGEGVGGFMSSTEPGWTSGSVNLPSGAGAGAGAGGGLSADQWLKLANGARGIMPGETGGGPRTGGTGQGTNWSQIIPGLLSAYYSGDRMRNYGGDLMGMFSRMEQNAQPFLQRLNESYTHPENYFNSPEFQAMQKADANRFERKASTQGRLSNNIDQQIALQDAAMAHMGDYRKGLQQSVSDLYGNAARYMMPYMAGSTAWNSSGAPWFAGLGQGQQGTGGIPWNQLWNAGSDVWDKYGTQIGDWLGGLFRG